MANDGYIDIPITVDQDALAQEAYDYLQSVMPGWAPNAGNLETWLTEAFARIAATIGTVASAVPKSIFRWFGAHLVNVPPVDAAPATTTTTWTVKDDAGYTIPDGTQVAIPGTGDTLIAFQTVGDTVIAPGSSATDAGAVTIVAINAGAAGSSVGDVDAAVQLLETLEFVTAITQTAATTGGVDAEDDDAYLDRLRQELQLLTPRPILPAEFATLARTIPGVARALAVDGYNPDDDTIDNPRMVCVFAIDAAGNAVGTGIKDALAAYLEAQREVNFVVNIADPTSTSIDVSYTIAVQTGYDGAVVQATVDTALQAFLSPANWGLPIGGDVPEWINDDTVRYTDIAFAILKVPGVSHIVSLGICESGGSPDTADVSLSGVAPLTQAGTITGATA